jgi:hypothetical protein
MNPESLNEVKSLVGKIDTKAMGQKSARQKPKQEGTSKKKQTKPKTKDNQSISIDLRGGNIL